MFREDVKRFYRELGKKTIKIQKPPPPDIGEVKKVWQNILEQEISHHEDAQWIKDQQEELKDTNQMEWKDFAVEELRVNITRAANWKSPGPDKLPSQIFSQLVSLGSLGQSSEVKCNPKMSISFLDDLGGLFCILVHFGHSDHLADHQKLNIIQKWAFYFLMT